jgi:hypothetical protein
MRDITPLVVCGGSARGSVVTGGTGLTGVVSAGEASGSPVDILLSNSRNSLLRTGRCSTRSPFRVVSVVDWIIVAPSAAADGGVRLSPSTITTSASFESTKAQDSHARPSRNLTSALMRNSSPDGRPRVVIVRRTLWLLPVSDTLSYLRLVYAYIIGG